MATPPRRPPIRVARAPGRRGTAPARPLAPTDVRPSRLVAAERAAQQFAHELPSRFKLGLIAFGPGATVLVSPTTDHRVVEQQVGQLRLSPGTAIGEAIYAALASIRAS